ncbi:hypothetical protein Tco_0999375 [Tanacetum coccineum]
MAKFQDSIKRLCLVDDLKMLKITMSNTSSRNKLNPEINDHYNIFTRESEEYELKTEDKAYAWRRRHKKLVTASQLQGDGVTGLYDGVNICRLKKPYKDSTG